jgi:CRP-like cAMP-binding protein
MSNECQHFTQSGGEAYGKIIPFDTGALQELAQRDSGLHRLCAPKPAHYSAKQVVYNEDTTVDSVIVIRSGMVKLVSHLPNGRARIVRVHTHGSWLGLSALLGRPHEHTAIAVDDIEAYHIPVANIRRIKSDHPHLYNQLLEHWYEYLQDADLWISEFSTGVIKARVARLVNFLSEIEDTMESGRVKLLTCEEMAEILGATPESVSRVLAEFKRDKVLYHSKLAIEDCYQCNVSALEAIAQQ